MDEPDLRWSPGRVPEPVDVTGGFDTDADGRADTLLTDDGFDLVVSTDLDGDGLADQVLRIGPDGVVRDASPPDHEIPGGLVAGCGPPD